MWDFLEKGQNSGGNPEGLESLVDELIHMTSQKTAGQNRSDNRKDLPFATVDLLRWSIVCEAATLVLDKRWPEIKKLFEKENKQGIQKLNCTQILKLLVKIICNVQNSITVISGSMNLVISK